MSTIRSLAFPLFAILVVGGIFLLWDWKVQPRVDKYEATMLSGTARGSIIGDGFVVLVDRVTLIRSPSSSRREKHRTRVTVVDAATGQKLLTQVIDGQGTCQAASPGRLWCDFNKLEAYETKTFTRLFGVEEVVAKAGVGRSVPGLWRFDGARAIQLLDDGRVAIVDAATAAVTRDDNVPKALRRDPFSNRQPSAGTIREESACSLLSFGLGPEMGYVPVTAADFAPGEDKKSALKKAMRRSIRESMPGYDGSAPGAHKKRGAPPSPPAHWAAQPGSGDRTHLARGTNVSIDSFLRPVVLGSDDPPLFMHHSSADGARDALLLSRLSADGSTAWTVGLRSTKCENLVMGPTWIVTTDNEQRRAFAVDPQSGAVRWEIR